MLINRLQLTNFRGIREGSMELSPITILLGSNNSGKSTMLEALFLAPNPCRQVPYIPGPGLRNNAWDVIAETHRTLDSKGYAFILYNYSSEKSEIVCDINGERYSLQFLTMYQNIYLTTNKEMRSCSQTEINNNMIKFFANGSLIDFNENVWDSTPFIEETLLVSSDLTRMGFEYMRQNWAPIINKGIGRRVAEDASTLSPQKYRDFTMEPFIGGKLEIYAFLEDGRRIRLGDQGEGIQNYIISRIFYEIVKPKVLLWDDIESHLNPRILRHLAEWFSDLLDEGRQVVLSTHSIEATKIIAGMNEEKTGIYLTALDNSILRTKRFTLSELEDLQSAGIDARTAEAVLL